MTRVSVYLNDNEFSALQHMAKRELRGLRKQAAWIIRRELEKAGLLAPAMQSVASGAVPGVVFDQRGAIVTQTVFATGSQQVNQSGEVNVNSGRDTTAGGDVTGRDKVSGGMDQVP